MNYLTDEQKLMLQRVWHNIDDTLYDCNLYNERRDLKISKMSANDLELLEELIENALRRNNASI